MNFYPRPPGGGRPLKVESLADSLQISIHALRVEGDREAWRAFAIQSGISIHALRVEGDARHTGKAIVQGDFYPRPPGGGRLSGASMGFPLILFLSTPSGWRATSLRTLKNCFFLFLSTPSGWRATISVPTVHTRGVISIHALRVEGDFFSLNMI